MDTQPLLRELSERDEDELLAELGAWHMGEGLGVRPGDFGRYVRLGRLWMEEHAGALRSAICDDERVRAARALLERDEAVEAATVPPRV